MGRKIYTRTGDTGCTNLGDGARVRKDSARCEAYGTLDEANALVGAALARTRDPVLQKILTFASHRLCNCSSQLACATAVDFGPPPVTDGDVEFIENAIDRMSASLAPLEGFILPAGNSTAALLHMARTVVRRAERRIVTLLNEAPVSPVFLKFVNRLSDLLFAAARYANHLEGTDDIWWDKDLPLPDLG